MRRGWGFPSNMQAVARQTNTVFGIRPVERIVTTLIEEGFPTKGFSVKGKSSNWGPQAGFICVDQHLSKRENRDTAEIRKLNLAVAKGMDGGAYTQTDLRISQQRLAELVRNFGLVADGVWPVRLLTAQGPSGKRYEFEARQEPDGLYRISRLGRSEAVQVLASPACGLAMTADYDLFLVAPSIEAHGSGGLDARRNTAVKYTPLGAKDPLSEDGFYGREDMARGNITPRTRQLVDALNDCLGRGSTGRCFTTATMRATQAPIWVTTSRPPSTFPGHGASARRRVRSLRRGLRGGGSEELFLAGRVHQGQRLSLHRPSRLERAAAAQLPGGARLFPT